jgi:hypothetical protein
MVDSPGMQLRGLVLSDEETDVPTELLEELGGSKSPAAVASPMQSVASAPPRRSTVSLH